MSWLAPPLVGAFSQEYRESYEGLAAHANEIEELIMNIVLHTRNAHLAEDFSEIAREKLQSMARFNVVIEGMKVEIKHESNPHHGKNSHVVTLTSHGAGPFLRAEGEGFNDLAAFDKAVASLELQIRKIHERSKDVAHETVITHLVN